MDDIRRIEEEAKRELDAKISQCDILAEGSSAGGKVSGVSDLSINSKEEL
jgi:hypothetical protein